MTTAVQNKARRQRHPNIYDTCEHLNTTQKTELGGKQIFTMATATDAQKTSWSRRNPNMYETCEHPYTTQKQNRGKEKIYSTMAMATDAQN